MQNLTNLDSFLNGYLKKNPWTNVYGLARTLLASATLLTLLLNNINVLIRPVAGSEECLSCLGLTRYSLFCLTGNVELTRWLCIAILALVASGYRPRFTAILHVWVSFSFMSSITLPDGGDQVTTVLTMLLLPICLTDNRKWHWKNEEITQKGFSSQISQLIALTTYNILRLQVMWIYFEACVGKFKVPEWSNGTALYYWLSNPIFGLSDTVKDWVMPILTNSLSSIILTWGVLALEGILFLGIAINKKYWKYLLKFGIFFHFMIFLIHGLPTFCIAMTAALILFYRPSDEPFVFYKINLPRFAFSPKEQVSVTNTLNHI